MKEIDLVIRNSVIVSSKGETNADIVIKDGKIQDLINPNNIVESKYSIDAKGAYVIPGCVDGHTHMMDHSHETDSMFYEDFTSGTMAAAVGGITTIVDHHRSTPNVYSVEPLLRKIEYLEDKSCVDFGLMGGISPNNTDDLEAMWLEGINGFKTFTCNLHGVEAMHSHFLIKSLSRIAEFDGIVLIHCEDDGICNYNEKKLKNNGRIDFASHNEWRSKLAEKIAALTVIEIAKSTNCRVVIAHVSQPEILEYMKENCVGNRVYSEGCPHYFYLTQDDLMKDGPWVKFTPPMNDSTGVNKLWKLFDLGYVTTIGSDHCPWPKAKKIKGEKNIWDAPNGIPGVETSLRLMLNGVNNGKTTLRRVVECMCENPAKLYGMFPRKGSVSVGSDADLVILNMEGVNTINNSDIISKCGWSPFNGKVVTGIPHLVLLRGEVISNKGVFVGNPGYGKFIRRLSST